MAVAAPGGALLELSWFPNAIEKPLEGKVPDSPTRPYSIPLLRFSKNLGVAGALCSLPQLQLSTSSESHGPHILVPTHSQGSSTQLRTRAKHSCSTMRLPLCGLSACPSHHLPHSLIVTLLQSAFLIQFNTLSRQA